MNVRTIATALLFVCAGYFSSFSLADPPKPSAPTREEKSKRARESSEEPRKKQTILSPANDGLTALRAAASGDIETLRELLADGRVLAPTNHGITALHVAAVEGQVEAMRVLLADGRFFAPMNDGRTALHGAAERGQVEAMRVLLADGRFLAPSNDGRTALHRAAERGQVEAMRVLLADGRFFAPMNDGATALHAAVQQGQVEAMRVLLADGRFFAPMNDGATALHVAAQQGQVEAMRVLLVDGRFFAPTNDGRTALHRAAERGQVEAMRVLLTDPQGRFLTPDNRGLTALHCAALRGQVEAVGLLLSDGRFLAPTNDGRTALHAAAVSNVNVLQSILQFILHFPNPEAIFGRTFREPIFRDARVSEEIKTLIRSWQRPEWKRENLALYPLVLRRALAALYDGTEHLSKAKIIVNDIRDEIAKQIINDYYYNDPTAWDPYNERNTNLRIKRHQEEIARLQEQLNIAQTQEIAKPEAAEAIVREPDFSPMQVHMAYLYTGQDVDQIIRLRLNNPSPITDTLELSGNRSILPTMQSTNVIQGIVDTLNHHFDTHAQKQQSISLVVNLGVAGQSFGHFIVLEIDLNGDAAQIRYIDSLAIDLIMAGAVGEQLRKILAERFAISTVEFTGEHRRRQPDDKSCGAIAAENLLDRFFDRNPPQTISLEEVRRLRGDQEQLLNLYGLGLDRDQVGAQIEEPSAPASSMAAVAAAVIAGIVALAPSSR